MSFTLAAIVASSCQRPIQQSRILKLVPFGAAALFIVVCADSILYLLLFYVQATCKVIWIQIPACDRARWWQLNSAAPLGNQDTSTVTWSPHLFRSHQVIGWLPLLIGSSTGAPSPPRLWRHLLVQVSVTITLSHNSTNTLTYICI